jgi:multiple sugar transport system ATP-binding protein
VVLKDGIIQQIGTPLGLYNKPVNRFVAGFIGSPPMNIMKATIREDNGKIVVDEGDFRITLTPELADAVRSYNGREVLFGVRPEDLLITERPVELQTISAKAEVVEPLGAEILLYVSTGQHPSIIVRTPPHYQFHVGDTVYVKPALEKAQFFDLETEKALV